MNDKIKGMLLGYAFGDALGTPYKLKKPVDVIFPPDADWSYETDQMIITMRCLFNVVSEDPDCNNNSSNITTQIAQALVNWSKEGFPELKSHKCTTVVPYLKRLFADSEFIHNPHSVSEKIWSSTGRQIATNSGVSRIIPLAVLPEAPVTDIMQITHFDSRCVAVGMLIHNSLHGILCGKEPAKILDCISTLIDQNIKSSKPEEQSIAKELKMWWESAHSSSADLKLGALGECAYIFRSFGVMIFALRLLAKTNGTSRPNFAKALIHIAKHGGDSDANCALLGAFLGAWGGVSYIPHNWDLVHIEWITAEIDKFIVKYMLVGN